MWNWKQYYTLALRICILPCLYLHHLSTSDLPFLLPAGPWLPAILLRCHSPCISTSYRLQRGNRKLFSCNQLQNKPHQSATRIESYSKTLYKREKKWFFYLSLYKERKETLLQFALLQGQRGSSGARVCSSLLCQPQDGLRHLLVEAVPGQHKRKGRTA